MKILLLSTGGHIGGEETFTRNLAKALIERGHNVFVAAGGPVQKQDLEKTGIPLADIDITSRSVSGILKGVVRLKKYIEKIKPDIVHCQAAGPAIMGGIIKKLGWSNGEKWIYHDHGINKFTYKWLPFFLNSLNLTITNSDFELIRLKANGVKDDRIVRIHNGVEPGDFTFPEETRTALNLKYRNEFGLSEEEFVLGYIGRLSPEKGCDLLLAAMKVVSDAKPETKLIIVGDGILRDKLQEDVRTSNLKQKVIFTGFRSDIPGVLTCMNVLVLPSYMETFSLTTLQAMCSGIPVIASDTGGNPEQVVNNFNGFLFETGNHESLAERILLMINKRDITGMGLNGNTLIKNYLNATRMIDEIEYQYKIKK
jgi:glycosyltransferase involved in cell wall biosynthesis